MNRNPVHFNHCHSCHVGFLLFAIIAWSGAVKSFRLHISFAKLQNICWWNLELLW